MGRFCRVLLVMAAFSSYALTALFFIPCKDSFSASVTSISQSLAMGFGKVTDGGTGGTITSEGAVTGGTKSLGSTPSFPLQHASIIVSGQNDSSTKFKVFLAQNAQSTMSNGAANANVTVSLSPSSTVTNQEFNFSSGTGTKTLTIPVYGTVTIGGSQASGDYTGNYTFYACACTSGSCPNNRNASQCQP